MSYLSVLAVTPDRRPGHLAEFRNSHGWHPSIWDRLLRHNGLGDWISAMVRMGRGSGPPTSYCNACRAWCRDPHADCVSVPLWVRMSAVRHLGMSVPDITKALRAGTLVYDPVAHAVHRPEETRAS